MIGYSLKECADMMDLHVSTVRGYARQPLFLEKLKGMSKVVYERVDEELKARTDSIVERLQAASFEALEEMVKLTKSPNEHIKLKAAQDLMDRDGRVSRTRRLEADTKHSFLSPLELVHMAQTARQVDEASKTGAPEARPALPLVGEAEGD